MTNKEKYDKVFTESFALEASQLADIEYNKVPAWDSIGHMSMVAALEENFDISMDTDDVINFSSYKKGFEILSKYGIQIELT